MTNVLIVEDEQAIRRFLRTALEGDGMRVFEAETLQRGLLEAATRKPDLIILDLGLPDGDGIEFIRDLRQWSAVPVIVLSARSEESDKIAALDAGADDYLSKPFGIGELQARLRVALRRHSATTTPDHEHGQQQLQQGSRPAGWVGRLPAAWIPYAELARLDKPIGAPAAELLLCAAALHPTGSSSPASAPPPLPPSA